MDFFIPITGLALGSIGLLFALVSSFKALVASKSIEIHLNNELGNKRLEIRDIDQMTQPEINEILSALNSINKSAA